MNITLRRGIDTKICKTGFSVTTFFFGMFVPLFRGDFKHFLIFLLLGIVAIVGSLFTFGIAGIAINLFICLKYNSWYIQMLLNEGYEPIDEITRNWLEAEGFNLYNYY